MTGRVAGDLARLETGFVSCDIKSNRRLLWATSARAAGGSGGSSKVGSSASACCDVPPPGGLSCDLLRAQGRCSTAELASGGWCAVTCQRCDGFARTAASGWPCLLPDSLLPALPAPPAPPAAAAGQHGSARQVTPTKAKAPTVTPTSTPTSTPAKAPAKAPAPTKSPSQASSTPVPTQAQAQESPAAVARAALDAHNSYRALHVNTAPLVWNATLGAAAQAWANRCVFQHSGVSGQGENLTKAFYFKNTAHPLVNGWASAVYGWYSENARYNYSSPGYQAVAGHFSQVVWKATTDVGCGAAACSDPAYPQLDTTIFVCRYWAQGNVAIAASFAANVLPRKAKAA